LAAEARVAREALRAILNVGAKPRRKTVAKALQAISLLAAQVRDEPITDAHMAESHERTAYGAPEAEADLENK
jgi:hypothetical protein